MKNIIAESEALLKGNLIYGNQDTITLLGNEAQSQFSYFTKMMTGILIQSNSVIDTTIQKVIEEMKSVESINNFSFLKGMFQSKIQKVEDSIRNYQEALDYMDKMVLQLSLQQAQILKNEKIFSEIEDQINEVLQEFDKSIAEGKTYLSRIGTNEDHKNTGLDNPFGEENWTIRLSRKITDLQTTQTVAIQSKVQLESMMKNSVELLDTISTLIIDVVPIWRKQISTFIKIQNLNKIQIQKKQSVAKIKQEIGLLKQEISNKNFSQINSNAIDSIQELVDLEKEESSIRCELKGILKTL